MEQRRAGIVFSCDPPHAGIKGIDARPAFFNHFSKGVVFSHGGIESESGKGSAFPNWNLNSSEKRIKGLHSFWSHIPFPFFVFLAAGGFCVMTAQLLGVIRSGNELAALIPFPICSEFSSLFGPAVRCVHNYDNNESRINVNNLSSGIFFSPLKNYGRHKGNERGQGEQERPSAFPERKMKKHY